MKEVAFRGRGKNSLRRGRSVAEDEANCVRVCQQPFCKGGSDWGGGGVLGRRNKDCRCHDADHRPNAAHPDSSSVYPERGKTNRQGTRSHETGQKKKGSVRQIMANRVGSTPKKTYPRKEGGDWKSGSHLVDASRKEHTRCAKRRWSKRSPKKSLPRVTRRNIFKNGETGDPMRGSSNGYAQNMLGGGGPFTTLA